MAQGRLHVEARKKKIIYIYIKNYYKKNFDHPKPNIIKLCTKFDNNFGSRLRVKLHLIFFLLDY